MIEILQLGMDGMVLAFRTMGDGALAVFSSLELDNCAYYIAFTKR
jgi:hypothetical protein